MELLYGSIWIRKDDDKMKDFLRIIINYFYVLGKIEFAFFGKHK